MRLKRSRVIWTAILVGVALAVAWALRTPPASVDTARITRGPLVVTVDEEGRTRVRDRFTISAPVAGHLMRITYRAGARVRAGDVVARISPRQADPIDSRSRAQLEGRVEAAIDALAEAQARAKSAVAGRDDAARALARQKELSEENLVPLRDLEVVETQHRQAEAEAQAAFAAVRVAEHDLQVARAALLASRAEAATPGSVEVRAPCDGAVLRVYEESERFVAGGTPLMEVGSPSSLEIVVDLLSTDAVRVQRGARALIERWGGEGTLEGRVRLVEPSSFTKVSSLGVEEQRVNVIVDFTGPADTWARLGDGYAVDVRVVVAERQSTLKVPTGALFRRDGDWHVFVVERDVAVERKVDLGLQTGLETEVLDETLDGQTVVVHPSDLLTEGARVRPR